MKFALIGEKLPHSYSKEIHEAFGLNYTLNEVEKGGVERFFKENDYDGFNVTIPYKIEVIKYIDKLSETAARVGSVNTVKRVDGKYYGYNTDVGGMRYMLKRAGVGVKDKTVLILGSGGTSLTARALCDEDGAKKCYVVSRSGEINYDNCYSLKGVQIIINCTPVGMYPNVDACPVDLTRFNGLEGVFDCIYNPDKTDLLNAAESLKIKCSNGLSMLVMQAALAEKIWTGADVFNEEVERVIKKIALNKINIVLSGMPSSGKSVIGREVANILHREFIDTDEEVVELSGKTPAEIIVSEGEKAFREVETVAIKNAAKLSGVVIAIGGGGILRDENVHALKRNGKICFLERDLSLLTIKNRPLSEKNGIEKLYNDRKDKYFNTADFTVKNDKDALSVAKEIILKYENSCD